MSEIEKRRREVSGWKAIVAGCLVPVLGGLAGCGGDDVGTSPGAAGGTGSALNQVPVVQKLDMRPAKPVPNRKLEVRAVVVDPDGDATNTRYVWQSSRGQILGEGQSFNTTGMNAGDRLQVVVTASDGQGESDPFVHKFTLAGPKVEVGFVAIDATQGRTPGSRFKAVVEATSDDLGGYDIEYEWIVAGEVVGHERELDTTPYAPGSVVGLRAKLDFGDRMSRAVNSRPIVLTRGDAPEITSEPVAGIEGGVFRYQIRAKGGAAGAKLSFELLEGPDGMTVDPTRGLVSWTPREDQRGTFKIEVAAKDQWGSGVAQSFQIQVEAPASTPASAR